MMQNRYFYPIGPGKVSLFAGISSPRVFDVDGNEQILLGPDWGLIFTPTPPEEQAPTTAELITADIIEGVCNMFEHALDEKVLAITTEDAQWRQKARSVILEARDHIQKLRTGENDG